MNLLIISHTPHYHRGSQIVGWGPTVREIDQLSKLFDQIRHLAILYDEQAPLSSLPYEARNITVVPVRPAGGGTLAAKLDVLRAYIGYLKKIRQEVNALNENDVIHVRCPANVSLLAVIYLIFNRKIQRRWIKYAGNWKPENHDPWSYALQRWLLRNNMARSVVTINGRWQDQPKHVLSFFNPSLSERDIQRSRENHKKKLLQPFQLLFVGNVNEGKGTGRAVKTALQLIASGLNIEMDIIGDGELCNELELKVAQAEQQKHIRFYRWLSHGAISPFYDHAHFILLPSRTEGWPKVLSEAMAYGTVPLAGAVSSIPQILGECKTGTALDPLDTQAFANAICSYIDNPDRWETESHAARQAAHYFTYEAYLERLTAVFADQWQLKL